MSTVGMYGNQEGYTIVNFMLMYIIGAYIKVRECKKDYLFGKILLCVLILTIWKGSYDLIGLSNVKSVWSYCNPIVILESVLLFKLFLQIRIRNTKLINDMSKQCFAVFLLQNTLIGYLPLKKIFELNVIFMLGALFCIAFGIYIICGVVGKIYHLLAFFIGKLVESAIKAFNN